MNLARITLWPYVVGSILMSLFGPVFFPGARLSFLIPSLVVLFYQRRLSFCLWAAFGLGLLLDTLSSSPSLELHVISFCTATALIYPQKRHFFADNISTLPILTFITSVTITLTQVAIAYIFQSKMIMGVDWVVTNLVLMPFFDSIYAFLLFQIPYLLIGKPRRRGRDFFLHSSKMD